MIGFVGESSYIMTPEGANPYVTCINPGNGVICLDENKKFLVYGILSITRKFIDYKQDITPEHGLYVINNQSVFTGDTELQTEELGWTCVKDLEEGMELLYLDGTYIKNRPHIEGQKAYVYLDEITDLYEMEDISAILYTFEIQGGLPFFIDGYLVR